MKEQPSGTPQEKSELGKIFDELRQMKELSNQAHQSVLDLAKRVEPIVEIYETCIRIGRWMKPLLFTASIIIAIIAGAIKIYKSIP